MANANPTTTAADAAAPAAPTKTTTIIMLLHGEGGATLGDLVAATGWLPHTTRAA
jgi:hypothetical protein